MWSSPSSEDSLSERWSPAASVREVGLNVVLALFRPKDDSLPVSPGRSECDGRRTLGRDIEMIRLRLGVAGGRDCGCGSVWLLTMALVQLPGLLEDEAGGRLSLCGGKGNSIGAGMGKTRGASWALDGRSIPCEFCV